MTDPFSLIKLAADAGLGGMSMALFFRLGKVVADHEVRIGTLEAHDVVRPRRHRRR